MKVRVSRYETGRGVTCWDEGRITGSQKVEGSNPSSSTRFCI